MLTHKSQDGYLWVTEWPLFVGDFALMAIMLVVCLVWYDIDKSVRGKRRFGL